MGPGLASVLEAAEGLRLGRGDGARHRAARSPRRERRSAASKPRLSGPPRPRRLGAGGALMPDPRRRLGARGEELAARHLEARGLEVVERNFRTRYGELDVVARDPRFLVFCEVKQGS